MKKKHTQPRRRVQISAKNTSMVRQAVRCALAPRRPTLHLSTGLLALGIAIPGSAAWPAAFPAEFELSSLLSENDGNGSNGVVLNGVDEGDQAGFSVNDAGDVNGDGIADLIIGAPYAQQGTRGQAGEVYVLFGGQQATNGSSAEFDLSNLQRSNGGNGRTGFILNGVEADSNAGLTVSAAGDVNADGFDDLVVGSRFARAYVVLGRNRFPAKLELSGLLSSNGGNGTAGFILKDGACCDDVAGAGDINGDGIDDLVIGAGNGTPGGRTSAGQTYVVFGRKQSSGGFPAELSLPSLELPNGGDGTHGFVLNGIESYNSAGSSVSGVGDVNGDSIDDLVVGSPGWTSVTDYNNYGEYHVAYSAEAYVIFGRDHEEAAFPAEVELAGLLQANGGDGSDGFAVRDMGTGYFPSRITVAGAGDINADGINDLLIGSAFDSGYSGQSYLLFGRNHGFPAEFDVAQLFPAQGGDGTEGVVFRSAYTNFSSWDVDAAGDINGDGIDDLIIGAPYSDNGRQECYGSYTHYYDGAGQTYVVFGQESGFSAEFPLGSLLSDRGGDGTKGFALNGIDCHSFRGDFSGSSLSGVGDVNGDGIGDLIIGAPSAGPGPLGAGDYTGESYVVFGRRESPSGPTCEGSVATILGTQGADDLRGTPKDDVINALGGNDIIRGLGGDDIICGGQGTDVIYGNAGNDTLFGQDGNDTLIGGGGIDLLSGSVGDDILRGGGGNDQLFGDEGDDKLAGGNGDDHLDGGDNNDKCNGGGGSGDTAVNCEKRTKVP